MPDSPG